MLMGVGCSFLVCLSIFLFDLLVECLVAFTNWWLKDVAFCWGVLVCFWLNVTVVLGCEGGCLLLRLLISVHRLWLFPLLDSISSSLAFHMFNLYSLICEVMLSFSCLSVGSERFLARSMFLFLISLLMCVGRGGVGSLRLPLGMWCLSARSMALVKCLFARWVLFGKVVLARISSISFLNLFQSALL